MIWLRRLVQYICPAVAAMIPADKPCKSARTIAIHYCTTSIGTLLYKYCTSSGQMNPSHLAVDDHPLPVSHTTNMMHTAYISIPASPTVTANDYRIHAISRTKKVRTLQDRKWVFSCTKPPNIEPTSNLVRIKGPPFFIRSSLLARHQ